MGATLRELTKVNFHLSLSMRNEIVYRDLYVLCVLFGKRCFSRDSSWHLTYLPFS